MNRHHPYDTCINGNYMEQCGSPGYKCNCTHANIYGILCEYSVEWSSWNMWSKCSLCTRNRTRECISTEGFSVTEADSPQCKGDFIGHDECVNNKDTIEFYATEDAKCYDQKLEIHFVEEYNCQTLCAENAVCIEYTYCQYEGQCSLYKDPCNDTRSSDGVKRFIKKVPKNCSGYKKHICETRFNAYINPTNQTDPSLYSYVLCIFENNTIETRIVPDVALHADVVGLQNIPVSYSLSINHIKSIIKESKGACHQRLDFNCNNTAWLYNTTSEVLEHGGWFDRNYILQRYWAGGRPSIGCACSRSKHCDPNYLNCQCDTENTGSFLEYGYIAEPQKLPITSVLTPPSIFSNSLHVHEIICYNGASCIDPINNIHYHMFGDITFVENIPRNWTINFTKLIDDTHMRIRILTGLRSGYTSVGCWEWRVRIDKTDCITDITEDYNMNIIHHVPEKIGSLYLNHHRVVYVDAICKNDLPAGDIEVGFYSMGNCSHMGIDDEGGQSTGKGTSTLMLVEELMVDDIEREERIPCANKCVFNVKTIVVQDMASGGPNNTEIMR